MISVIDSNKSSINTDRSDFGVKTPVTLICP